MEMYDDQHSAKVPYFLLLSCVTVFLFRREFFFSAITSVLALGHFAMQSRVRPFQLLLDLYT